MRVNFILPRNTNKPMGGYKIVYQYAKRLALDGNEVHVFFAMFGSKFNLKTILRKIDGLTLHKQKYRSISWFNLKNVKIHYDQTDEQVYKISKGKTIATHWATAKFVNGCHCKNNEKFYFIQDYEIFDSNVTKEQLEETWKYPIQKIMVSKWLVKKAREMGISSKNINYVPNFIDTNEFPIINNELTQRNCISFLWHNNVRKQSDMGIRIAEKLKKTYPLLKIIMFGSDISAKPNNVIIVDNADIRQLNNIYRHSIVYFMPSRREGWGLTGMEAMACGAAVATIDNGGIWEYANDKSAIIVKNNEDELFKAIKRLIDNSSLRKKIVNNAFNEIKNFTFNKSYQKLLITLGI